MNNELIKKALDNFENDKFSDAKEILQKEIRERRAEFLNDKLGLNEASKTLKDVTFAGVEGSDDSVQKNLNKVVPKNIKVKVKWSGTDNNDNVKANVSGSPDELKKFQEWYDNN